MGPRQARPIPSVTDRQATAIWKNTCAMHSETIANAAPERRIATKPIGERD